MEPLKLRAYTPASNRLKLIWEHEVSGEYREKQQEWFIHALKRPTEELDHIQFDIRAAFINETGRPLLRQGDMLCVGKKQCYIMY